MVNRKNKQAELQNKTKQFWLVLKAIASNVSKKKHESFLFQQLKQQRDKLKVYQKRIELSLVKDRELAKKCLAMGRKE